MSQAPLLEALPHDAPARRDVVLRRESGSSLFAPILTFFGWCWRLAVGPLMCTNYLLSVAVLGWLSRHMQGVIVRSWWKQSDQRLNGTFTAWCDALGPGAPTARPRWFWRERIAAAVSRPLPGGRAAGGARKLWRALGVPIHSLWQNFVVGFQFALGTFLLAGWGFMIMEFSWLFGWYNSFHKGYEISYLGPLTGLLGVFLFVAAMFYVPMAQAHFSLTGEFRSFFDFQFVWRLIRARLLAYAGVTALLGLAVVPLEIATIVPKFFEAMNPGFYEMNSNDYAQFVQTYLFWVGAYLFIALLIVRHFTARVYASAVLSALRRGTVAQSELHPKIAGWLKRLELDMTPTLSEAGLGAAMVRGGGWLSRCVLFTFIFVVWFAVISARYVGEFFNYHPFTGFGNHPLVLLPCPGTVPGELQSK
jgi:hypothetical protein